MPVRSLIGLPSDPISHPMENIIPNPQGVHPDVLSVLPKEAPGLNGQFLGDLNRTNYVVDDRIMQQYNSIIKLRDEFLSYRKFFPLSELVQGGFVLIPAMDIGHLDYNIIRTIADGYYFGLMERLVFNLDKRSHRILVTDLMNMLGNAIEKALAKTWMSKSDDELSRQAGLDSKLLLEEVKKHSDQRQLLETSLQEIKEVQDMVASLITAA